MEIIIGIAAVLLIIAVFRGFSRGSGSKGTTYRVATILQRFITWGIKLVVLAIIVIIIFSMFK